MPLLPLIELQPPTPPQMIGPSTSGRGGKQPAEPESAPGSLGAAPTTFNTLSPTTSSSSLFFTPSSSPHLPALPNKLGVSHSPGKSPGSQQSASLGHVAAETAATAGDGGVAGQGNGAVPCRNSLGDLKIPAQISQAQASIKRDLAMVREFANNVEQLKEMQMSYNALVAEVQMIFESHIQQHTREASPLLRTTSPNFFANLSMKARPKTRGRSNMNPTPGQTSACASTSQQDVSMAQLAYKEMASMFYTINSKYRISWECAELLIELGGGAPGPSATSPHQRVGALHTSGAGSRVRCVREEEEQRVCQYTRRRPVEAVPHCVNFDHRALEPAHVPPPHARPARPPPASPPNMSWRASTGRHDPSQRQLVLLREMLNNANAASVADEAGFAIPEESLPSLHSLHVNKDWKWGDARNSTITLPSEESGGHQERRTSTEHKRKHGRLGMAGIWDMWIFDAPLHHPEALVQCIVVLVAQR